MGDIAKTLGKVSSYDLNIGGLFGESKLDSSFSSISNLQSIIGSKTGAVDLVQTQLKEGTAFHKNVASSFMDRIKSLEAQANESIQAMQQDDTSQAKTAIMSLRGSSRSDFSSMLANAVERVEQAPGDLRVSVIRNIDVAGSGGTEQGFKTNVIDTDGKIEQIKGTMESVMQQATSSFLPQLKKASTKKAVVGMKLESKLKKDMSKIGSKGGEDFASIASLFKGLGGGLLDSAMDALGDVVGGNLNALAKGGDFLNGISSNDPISNAINEQVDSISNNMSSMVSTISDNSKGFQTDGVVAGGDLSVSNLANQNLNNSLVKEFNSMGGNVVSEKIKSKINSNAKNRDKQTSNTLNKKPNYIESSMGTKDTVIPEGSYVASVNGLEDLQATVSSVFADDRGEMPDNTDVIYNVNITTAVASSGVDIEKMAEGTVGLDQVSKEWNTYSEEKKDQIANRYGFDDSSEFLRSELG